MSGSQPPVYFFSDAHLTTTRKPGEAARSSRLERFLVHVRENASKLIILGDLFDFWFEYRHAIPAGQFNILRRLQEIRENEIPIVFIAGNHDYWCGDFFRREIGMETHADPITLELQGRHLWLAHGDGLVSGDWGYRVLRKVLRNRLCILGYRMLHPDLGIPLAHASSSSSREHTREQKVDVERFLTQVARPRFRDGYDAVILGHIHKPVHVREEGRDFIFLGDWIRHFTYVTLTGGALEQHRWEE
jgi:UDP-2,3-diacylglucosamine hydrolase